MAFTKVAVIFFFLMAMDLCHYSSIAEDSFENKNLITSSDNTLGNLFILSLFFIVF